MTHFKTGQPISKPVIHGHGVHVYQVLVWPPRPNFSGRSREENMGIAGQTNQVRAVYMTDSLPLTENSPR